jgi:hypothetical protein
VYPTDDGKWSYTEPVPGAHSGTGLGPLPPGKKREECSSYHTHGDYDPSIDYSRWDPNYVDGNEEFSPSDMYKDAQAGTPGYLGTPKGKVKRYDPPPDGQPSGAGKVTTLSK